MRTLSPPKNCLTKSIFDGSDLHKHVIWEIVFFTDNNCLHYFDGESHACTVGDVFIISPNHAHYIEPLNDDHRHQDLYFTDEQVRKICSRFDFPSLYEDLCRNIIHIRLPTSTQNLILNDLKTIETQTILAHHINNTGFNEETFNTCSSICEALLHFLLIRHVITSIDNNGENNSERWITTLLYNLNDPLYFSQSPNAIIKNSGYSHSRFSELFKKHVGVSLVDYMINKRMDYAEDLLTTTKKTTLEIATIIGYESYSCFVRTFKRKYGLSPQQYRKRHKKIYE